MDFVLFERDKPWKGDSLDGWHWWQEGKKPPERSLAPESELAGEGHGEARVFFGKCLKGK